jgi:putative CocE/NonD family hydrolase
MTGAALADALEVAVERHVMVAMRDGVRLATDIHLPARGGKALPGPFPVLVERTPYNKEGTRASDYTAADPTPISRVQVAAFFVRRGYAVVLQDCRGRFRSEGVFTKYLGEANDGFDTLAWIAAQPWCSGRIGTTGLSYCAHTQTALAALRPPGLAAMFLDCGGFANAYRGGIRHGGAFELKQATWAYRNAGVSLANNGDKLALAAHQAEDIAEWFRAMPWKRGHSPLRWAPEYESYLFDQWERGAFDDYWRTPELYAAGRYDAFAGIPTMLMCGWWDPYTQTTSDNYIGIAAQPGGDARLVFGPWLHGQRSRTSAGDVSFGPEAAFDGRIAEDYFTFQADWFDRWLQPAARPRPEGRRVRYFRMGGGSGGRAADGRLDHGGRWLQADDWPLPGTDFRAFYLHADGRLDPRPPAKAKAAVSFDFDPAKPVPTIGGNITSGLPVMHGGAFDQRTGPKLFGATAPYLPLAARPDVLVFATPPLAEDVEVTGPIVVRLWISSDAPDTDFTAKLIDWQPPHADFPQGFAMNLTDGILRCRYRKSWEAPEPLAPGEIAEIVIEPPPTSNLFRRGHRIRLDISSSNFPHFDVNPNTGEPEGRALRRRVAVNTVHMDRQRPSHIVLPIVPAGSS